MSTGLQNHTGAQHPAARTPPDKADLYQGFSLKSVTWGYRQIFADTIDELFRQGCLGPQRREVTGKFFELLKLADQSCFDHVLRQFLGALTPHNRWIMDLPGIFTDLVDQGASLATGKFHQGIRFFEILSGGGMGDSPRGMRECLNWLRRLRKLDDELAMAFLEGYDHLRKRMLPLEIERFLEAALQIHHANPDTAYKFLRGEIASAETYILAITRECRLSDMAESLRMLLRGLTGEDWIIADLGQLDADDLMEHGTQSLTVSGHVYLPERCRIFQQTADNRNWYRLCGVISAAALLEDSFPRIHGHPHYTTCASLAGGGLRNSNLFVLLECVRVLRRAAKRWPGSRRLIEFGLENAWSADELAEASPNLCLRQALDTDTKTEALSQLRAAADACINCFDAAQCLEDPWSELILSAYPGLRRQPLTIPSFFSDFMFPVNFSNAVGDQLVADLKDASRQKQEKRSDQDATGAGAAESDAAGLSGEKQDQPTAAAAAYIYDEWDFQQNDYRPDWCHLRQHQTEPHPPVTAPANYLDEAQKIRALFERLKPDLANREKRLPDGDDINMELLIEYKLERLHQPAPPIRFYEKPLIRQRDLATLVLLDTSGSTGEAQGGNTKVLDMEKQAALALGTGLHLLGDRFAVCGFNSNGREHCEYQVFKDFPQEWDDKSIARIMNARPQGATRIGPALRHAGYLLAQQPSRQRLIILVTDGQPMDQDYSPETRYAQHDVRMACEENARQDIHTFAISTLENSLADMEIMFPGHKFVILTNIRQLPQILPRLYLRLTL
ncbi:MAG: VWA domain-containing protein [Lentisphaerae bacterium]|nr:VWA domain-containing protein [Lentisphaerota bacterium]